MTSNNVHKIFVKLDTPNSSAYTLQVVLGSLLNIWHILFIVLSVEH